MTHDEMIAVIAGERDGKRVQKRGFGASDQWENVVGTPTWNFAVYEFRLAPEPVPPGDLTWEKAKELAGQGVSVQAMNKKTGIWFDLEAPDAWDFSLPGVSHYAYRLKPAPRMVPLGPEDVDLHRDLFRHNQTVAPGGDCCAASRKNVNHLWVYDAPITWGMAQRCLERSTDGGLTWRRCEKPEVQS